MCGRYTLRLSREIADAFALLDAPELFPRYNIAPTQNVAIVRSLPGRGDRGGPAFSKAVAHASESRFQKLQAGSHGPTSLRSRRIGDRFRVQLPLRLGDSLQLLP
jgi:putative SOS response-associated peptidase YedK